jgi:hypothetical protein
MFSNMNSANWPYRRGSMRFSTFVASIVTVASSEPGRVCRAKHARANSGTAVSLIGHQVSRRIAIQAPHPLSWLTGMTALRRRLGLVAAAWLAFQVVSFSALVASDCCAAHRSVAEKQETGCHTQHTSEEPSRPKECAMRGTCDGPIAALFELLSNYGILPDAVALSAVPSVAVATNADANALARLESPDSPPPRV